MDKARFTTKSPGELVQVHLPGPDWAFIPDPLSTKWTLPEKLWPQLMAAREAIARLDGVGRHMLNYELLLRPLQNREALRSSSLEGTFATPEQLLLYEIDPKKPGTADDPANAWREVLCYSRALDLGLKKLSKDLPLSLRLVRIMHERLMQGGRGGEQTPGEFRRRQVHVGSDRRFIPPPQNMLSRSLDEFEKYIHTESTIDPLIRCFMIHYQFETIHPFIDGNGRVGRLLLSLMIYTWCGLSRPWLYLSAFFDRYKDEYINLLFRVSTHGDWEAWIDFCLRGTVAQAEDAILRCDKLIALNKKYHDAADAVRLNARAHKIIDQIFERPVLTIPALAKEHKVTYPTAQADIDQLIKLGVLSEAKTDLRPQHFVAKKIMQVAYSDSD